MIESYLKELDISRDDAAEFLSVNPRTIRRWIEYPDKIPSHVIQTFEAWKKLKSLGEPWKPGEISLKGFMQGYGKETIDWFRKNEDTNDTSQSSSG